MTSAPVRTATRRRDAGFTLIEVIVALAILATAVVASIQGFAGGLRLLKLSGDHQQAILLADQKIREATILEEGREEGTEGIFTWERTIEAVAAPELTRAPSVLPGIAPPVVPPVAQGVSPAPTTIVSEPQWRVVRLEVKVKWERRSVELVTLRTEPVQKPGMPGVPTAASGAATSLPGVISPPVTSTLPRR